MIKIRYSSLPEGLHAQACRESGHTIVYLRPGLSSQQRREALRRARQSARMGHGPRLPAAGLAVALATDRVTGTVRNLVAAVRCHPFGTGMLAALVAGAVVSYSLFVTVSVRIIYPQVVPPVQPPATAPGPGQSPPGGPGRSPVPGASSSATALATPSPGLPSPGGSSPGQPSPGPPPTPTPAPPPSPTPSPTRFTPLPTPSPTRSGGGGLQVCVKVGPLGVCLRL